MAPLSCTIPLSKSLCGASRQLFPAACRRPVHACLGDHSTSQRITSNIKLAAQGNSITATSRLWGPGRARSVNRAVHTTVMAAKKLIALDFDGVVCDSCGESSLSAFKAAQKKWPEIFNALEAISRQDELVEKMRAVRPVVETGYENIVQIRCLLEGVAVDDMLESWDKLLPEYMSKWQLDRQELVHLFGSTRDEWIESDLAGWLAPNRIYPGVAAAVSTALAQEETYIVTTKQAHFTELLLKEMAQVNFPGDRIYSQTLSGQPKSEVLKMLAERHVDASQRIFVEDKLSTLEKVCKLPDLENWDLFLVDWGYNTAKERARAAENPRITVIDIKQFTSILT